MALSKIKGTVIADDAINADRIADGTVVASDLLDNTITGAKLATDIAITTSGNITTTGALTSTGIDDNATSTAITIDSSNRVSIRNTSTTRDFHVGDSSGATTMEIESASDSTGTIFFGDTQSGASGRILYDHTDNYLRLDTNGSERMRINNSGNVGIGTTTINDNLSIFGGSTDDISLLGFMEGTTTQFGFVGDFGSTGSTGNSLRLKSAWTTNVVTFRGDGNVGIGTSSPEGKLHIQGDNVGTPSTDADDLVIEKTVDTGLSILSTTTGRIFFGDASDNNVGGIVYVHTDDSMRFSNNASESMRIDSSGNVGIGTSSPNAKLDVRGSAIFNEGGSDVDFRVESDNQANMLFVDGGNDRIGIGTSSPQAKLSIAGAGGSLSGASSLSFYDTNSNSSRRWSISNGAGGNETSSIGQLFFSVGEGSVTADPMAGTAVMVLTKSARVGIGTSSPSDTLDIGAGKKFRTTHTASVYQQIYSSVSGNFIYAYGDNLALNADSGAIALKTVASQPIVFQTNSSDAMRIDGSGNVLIGTTSVPNSSQANNSLCVAPTMANSTQTLMQMENNLNTTATGGKSYIDFYNGNGSEIGSITGNQSGLSYNTSSDYRLKENVSYDFDATTRLKQLKPARFNFIADADTTVDGFLAHEVSSVVPEAVTGEKDAVKEDGTPDYQGIDQSKLVPLLVKTIQELEARITALETNQP